MARDQAYLQAEKKIEEARRSGTTELDLWQMKLTELPESLGQLAKLQNLNLSLNQLTSLPEWLGQLTKLHSLRLSGNPLTALPEWLGQLTQLQSLELAATQLTALPESLEQLTQLQSLDISQNSLTVVPKWLRQLMQLQSLDFSGNPISELPEWLGQLKQLQSLAIPSYNQLILPEWLEQLTQLQSLSISGYYLTTLPEWLGKFTQLQSLNLSSNALTALPEWLEQLTQLQSLNLGNNELTALPEWLGQLTQLQSLNLVYNKLTDLPTSLAKLEHLYDYEPILNRNPLNPELAEAYKQGLGALKLYLRLKVGPQVILNESKLILVGEGEVGKTCLMDALLGRPWKEHDATHGIEIKPIKVTDPDNKKEITLNGWDFGGQRVYRPTHQLFFSAPAVYLVIWKPREGPQQGFVKEWINLIKHREPDAKILVVATHGGPGQRQPDIDRQELIDLFGKDTVLGFHHVESKPDEEGKRRGIEELKQAIARVAVTLPEVGRSVPKRWQETREALEQIHQAYVPLDEVMGLCKQHGMDNEEARLFITISHRLGHLIHYEHDPALQDIVVLKPDWLATAISFVLDDEATRKAHGLVRLSRLAKLWDEPSRPADSRYPKELHRIFVRLMERFDLSYRAVGLSPNDNTDPAYLIAQLVPDNRPESIPAWSESVSSGDIQQEQICRIVDQKDQSAAAEGLFYQLIVRLHKYSLGRVKFPDSVHWQRGLVLDDDYNGRALLEHKGNDVRITVRAPYPERFLAMLTAEVKYLVESFWEGLRCNVMVPCIEPCGRLAPGTGLFDVQKLIASKRRKRFEFPCPVCNEWQDIDSLLRNAPAARPVSMDALLIEFAQMRSEIYSIRPQLAEQQTAILGRFSNVDAGIQRLFSQAENNFTKLLQVFTDEAKEGPRLFSLIPVERSKFNPKEWTNAKFRLTLWCEHSRLPLPELNGKDSTKGVYELELTRDWFKKAAPYLRLVTGALSLVLPVASSAVKLAMDETAYKAIENELDFGKEVIDASLTGSEKAVDWLGSGDSTNIEHGEGIRAQGATLRELHALLKAKDPSFGGLVRVMNKRQEFLWVHERFASEY